MDFKQFSIQIGPPQTIGELKASGSEGLLGSSSRDSEFSTILQTLSRKVDGRMGVKSRMPQPETNDRSDNTTRTARRALSRKADGNRAAKSRAPQSEADDRQSMPASDVSAAQSRKADGNRVGKSRAPQSEADDRQSMPASDVSAAQSRKADGNRDVEPRETDADDGLSTMTSGVPAVVSQETSDGTDTESRIDQSETGDEPSTIMFDSEPLLSLLGATMAMSVSPVVPTQEAAWTDAPVTHIDGLSDLLSEIPAIQTVVQPFEGIASSVTSETGHSDRAVRSTASATGESDTAVSSPIPEVQPLSAGTDRAIPVVAQSDISRPLTALQSLEAKSGKSQQGPPIKEQQAAGAFQIPDVLEQTNTNEQDLAQPVSTATAQPTTQSDEAVEAQPDRLQAQQVLGKGERSLHQRNMQSESSEAQPAETLFGQMQANGQGFNAEFDGQGKEEGLKWFSRADLQSAEVSRLPQQSGAEPLGSGHQSLPYPQSQGGAPSNSQSVSAPAVPPSSQTNRLSPDLETAPVPLTQAVQFDLAPADFGQLRVRVVLSDHTVHTRMSTDRAELGQMLTSQQEQLSTQLTVAGLDLGRFQVQVDQERSNHSGQEWPSQAQGGPSQQQRNHRQQEPSHEAPLPIQKRTGMLSLFA
jgi:Flagellar hook-length control protein FliK